MNFKEIRFRSCLSQKAFSEKYNIPLRTIQDWESGRRNPPEYLLDMLAYITASGEIIHTAWVFNEFSEERGYGRFELFRTKDEAVAYTKSEWDALLKKEQEEFLADPTAEFYAALFPVEWNAEDGMFVPDFGAKSTLAWDALASERKKRG